MKLMFNNFWWMASLALLPFSQLFAETHEATGASYWGPIGVGLGFGIAAAGGALGQGKIGAAFMEGVARNPGAKDAMFVPLILALALVETLVLFGFAVSYLLMGNVFHA